MEDIQRTHILERTRQSDSDIYLVFAIQFIKSGQFKQAIKMCDKALVLVPNNQKAKELIERANKDWRTSKLSQN